MREAKHELESMREDLQDIVDVTMQQQQQRARPTHKMKAWLQSIEVILKELDSSLQKGDQEMEKKCLGNCCCCINYVLGKETREKINIVRG